jgi:serine/threonine-protein kinase
MEFLEGEELRTLLKREKVLKPERVIRMMAQVAIGLQAAHDRKVVHRDMKPDNIFLCGTREGDVCKILDFGSVRDNSVGAKKLTVVGTTIGSPFYMAPEQAQALRELDHRADIWSVAAMMYESLTGSLPFSGTKGTAILLAILMSDPVPPSEIGREQGVPASLDPVMEAALAKNPALRMQSIGALIDRVGHAYGLTGTHLEWATTPEADLAARIVAGLPDALAKHAANPKPDRLAGIDEAFKAGSEGGPGAFPDDMVMGVPKGPPTWIYALVAGSVLLGALAALLLFR